MPSERNTRAPDARTRRMFSYLDGELHTGERDAFEAEIASDQALAAEVASFRVLLATLDEVAAFAPAPDLRVRVLASLNVRESWWARLQDRLRGGSAAHMRNAFTALLEEGLTTRQARALTAFVAGDPEAAAALAGWRRLYRELEALPGFAPSEGFADRVMARVHVLEQQGSARQAVVRSGGRVLADVPGVPALARYWTAARGWMPTGLPRRRERFAVASGMAVGPAAVFAATFCMLSGNPLLTPSNVAGFLGNKISMVFSGLTEGLIGGVPERISGFLDGWALSGPSVAAGLAFVVGLALVSAWILYTNVVKISLSESRYVPV